MKEDYYSALKKGRRAYHRDIASGRYPFLPALDDLIAGQGKLAEQPLGLVEIPLVQVTGTRTKGRQESFSSNYMPMLNENSEFALKWGTLYDAQINEGIRDPVKVYEYLWNFYTLEGNKRVSVLKFLNVPTIMADVTRVLPANKEDPLTKIYYEFVEFYEVAPIYDIRFSESGSYQKLAVLLGKDLKTRWADEEVWNLRSAYNAFAPVYEAEAKNHPALMITTGDAFLCFINIYPIDGLLSETRKEIAAKVQRVWNEFRVESNKYSIDFVENPELEKKEIIPNALKKILPSSYTPEKPLKIAFIYDRNPEDSRWIYGHELGRNHLTDVFGSLVDTIAFSDCDTEEKFQKAVEAAAMDGDEIVITPSSAQMNQTLRAAIQYPKIRFLNCSINLTSSAVITYYGRMYEAKFLMGALAASVSRNHKIGYVADYPIYGTVANINAFALGAAFIDPYVEVHLAWSTLENKDWHQFMNDRNIRVVSALDMIKPSEASREYGIYQIGEDGSINNLAVPVWNWGKYYELIVQTIFNDTLPAKSASKEHALNYWWGMSSGVIDVILSKNLPFYSVKMVNAVRNALIAGTLNPFAGELHSQKGIVREADSLDRLTNEEIVSMDWLNDNVVGSLPVKAALSEVGKKTVETSGVIKE